MRMACLYSLLFSALLSFSQEVQWASKVLDYSSQYGPKQFSAQQIIGKPGCMPTGGENPVCWKTANLSANEWIRVSFEKPMKIRQILIAEAFYPGAVINVELTDKEGKSYKVYKQKAKLLQENARMLHIDVPLTEYEVASVKITLDLLKNAKFSCIDAIGISASSTHWYPKQVLATDIQFVSERENLGDSINSTYDELLPLISPDGKTLFICRDDDPKGIGAQDILFSEWNANGKWGKAQNIGTPLNNSGSNFVCSVSPDGNRILLGGIYGADEKKGVYQSSKDGKGVFGAPVRLEIRNYYNKANYNEYCMANSGKLLLMSLEREDTYGGMDIYFSELLDDGTWSEPQNAGAAINTAANENCPFLAADEKTLFFSSSGHMGFGSNDIFMTKRIDSTWNNWTEPLNLGPAINSPAWDAYYTLPASADYAYFTSAGRSLGGIDIFRIKLPREIQPDPVMLVLGKVLSAKTEKPLKAIIRYVDLATGKEAGIATSDSIDGYYKLSLPYGKKYGFSAEVQGYVAVNENLDVSELKEYKEIGKDLYMVPIEAGQTVRLNNIFFETGKAELLFASYIELEKLVMVLRENKTMEIEIEGHTDDVGSDAINLTLSKDRAKAVKEFLLSKGISASRILSTGFGETKPLGDNRTEEGRAENRRVQFTISKK